MKKQELLKIMDDVLLEKLFGFCYSRTSDSYEAQELCSDIVFALVKSANTAGDIIDIYPFIWQTARNVYADFCTKRKKQADFYYQGDPTEMLSLIAAEEIDDNSDELLQKVYHRISFLTRAYREVMILYYMNGLSTAEIAKLQNISETAVRQRLFSARKKIKKEVENMTDITNIPITLDTIDFSLYGYGNPLWSDPRNVCTRQLSKHIIWLCRKKPMNALELAEKLNIPTVYVEEELDILAKGENGKYGLLRRLDNGRYGINIILLDKAEVEKVYEIYRSYIPAICKTTTEFMEEHKQEYLSFPYLNKRVELNLVLWQQLAILSRSFPRHVARLLQHKYFADVSPLTRPFSVYGHLEYGVNYIDGWNNTRAENICGYSEIQVDNINNPFIKEHFYYGHNIANDRQLQLALRAIEGLDMNTLSYIEKEHAAKAIENGYLYREGEMLYTKILVSDMKDQHKLFAISSSLTENILTKEAEAAAEKMNNLIRSIVPDYLLSEWMFINDLAEILVADSLTEALIEKGILTPPEDRIGAEGCWMSVMRPQIEERKKKVLVVDDAPFIRNFLAEQLSKEYQIITAEDGDEGVELFKSECPDAVFLDINMPKLGGVDALRQMLEINSQSSIIMLTAVDRQEVIDECKKAGAADYIIKPFGMEQILQALHTALNDE